MTTEQDYWNNGQRMLHCELRSSNLYPALVLALRDMRKANGRDEATGAGEGNESWIGLSLAMIVLDTLSGDYGDDRSRWEKLLKTRGLSKEDATIIFKLRCSLLHGYYPPNPEHTYGRKLLLTDDRAAHALDTSRDGLALVSVPVFCGRLVERVAIEVPNNWDVSLINTRYPL